MAASHAELREALSTLERRWERLTEVPETPRTLLNVIEYSLGKHRKAEVYVNRMLRYFLDPEAPHGMGDEFLRAFLEGLPEECGFAEDTHDLSAVRVADQVSVEEDGDGPGGSESKGIADLLIDARNEWLLITELKFSAGENNLRGEGHSQTEHYYWASHIDERPKDDYESGAYYLYVHPEAEPSAREPNFANWTWEALATGLLEPFLSENAPRYPHRTVVQLRELVDDIQEITGMTDQHTTDREKIELYLEHYEAIHAVTEAFEERWEAFAEEWPTLLEEALQDEGIDTTDWNFSSMSRDWGQLFRKGWWRRQSDLEPISERDVSNDARVSFIHRLQGNRDAALGDRTLVFTFRNAGSNDQAFIDEFVDRFSEHEDEIEQLLPEAAALTGKKRNLIEARYDIRTDAHEDFFQAYIAALEEAFMEHAADNGALLSTIESIYEQAIDIYE